MSDKYILYICILELRNLRFFDDRIIIESYESSYIRSHLTNI